MNKKRLIKLQPFGIILITFIVLLIALLLNFSKSLSQSVSLFQPPQQSILPSNIPTYNVKPSSTTPPECVPYSAENSVANAISTVTPTPFLGTPSLGDNSKLSPRQPSVTPIPYAHTYDLSPSIDINDKSEIDVYRCNGTYDRYFLGPNNNQKDIPLGKGDRITLVLPPFNVFSQHPGPNLEPSYTPSSFVIQTPTNIFTSTTIAYP